MRRYRFEYSRWEAGMACETRKEAGVRNPYFRVDVKPTTVTIVKKLIDEDTEGNMTCGSDEGDPAIAMDHDEGLAVADFRKLCLSIRQNRSDLVSAEFGQTLVYNRRELSDYNAMMLEAAMSLSQNTVVEKLTLNENAFGANLPFASEGLTTSTAALLSIAHWIRGSSSLRKLTAIVGNYGEELSYVNSQIAMGFLECIVCGSSLVHPAPRTLDLRELSLHSLRSLNVPRLLAAMLDICPQLEKLSLSYESKMHSRLSYCTLPDEVGDARLHHALMRHSSLKSLKLENVATNISQAILLGVRSHSQLSEVGLAGHFLSYTLKDFFRGNRAVQKLNLTSMQVCRYRLHSGTDYTEELCGIWPSLARAKSVRNLQITNSDLFADCDRCQAFFNRNELEEISIEGCYVPRVLYESVCELLQKQTCRVRHLSLTGVPSDQNKQLDEDSLVTLGPGLQASTQLEEFNLQGNRLQPGAILHLANLIPRMSGLRALGLDYDGLHFAMRCGSAMPSFAEAILKSNSLEDISTSSLAGVEEAENCRNKILFSTHRNRLTRLCDSVPRDKRRLLLPFILATAREEIVGSSVVASSLVFILLQQHSQSLSVSANSRKGSKKRASTS